MPSKIYLVIPFIFTPELWAITGGQNLVCQSGASIRPLPIGAGRAAGPRCCCGFEAVQPEESLYFAVFEVGAPLITVREQAVRI